MAPEKEVIETALPLQSVTNGEPAIVAVIAGTFIVGLLGAYIGYSRYQRSKLIEETETAPIGSVTQGRTAISGTVRPVEEPLESPVTESDCVQYSFSVKDLVETDTEGGSSSDSDVVDSEKEWKRIEKGSDETPFYVDDESGAALVELEDGITYNMSSDNQELVDDRHGDGMHGLSDDDIPNDVIKRQYTESVLPIGEEVCVLGESRRPSEAEEGADIIIGRDPESDLFIVADKTKTELADSMSITGPLIALGGLAVSGVMLIILVNDFVLV
ncbi:E3 ubiquitin ligase family protein [Natrinema halophilum]|uniref:E3 ubiquitin ligase family protein n=1 Tax=Natrinema halophilum TaxID=1699371 RepID=UPI001F1E005C|nr:E3 ubiquitin ligase family protein [Natrinema halophilum]UHQ96244.1 E3 ubiquitin ligase family protein [Natrinema halophilum]